MGSASLSRARTARLTALLALVIACSIALVCTIAGFIGSAAVESGAITFEELTSPGSVVSVIVVGSLALTAIVCTGVSTTLASPLHRMTFAVEQLAQGNFSYRMKKTGKLSLREVDKFAQAFNVAAAELASTEMMRASFISDFSHEFRTPINSLSGFAQLLAEDDLSEDERREYALIIVEESRRLAGLSERILLLSKMEAATILPDVERVDIAEQLRQAVALLDHRMKEKNLILDVSLDACAVSGNADYLAQLWTNLLDNAVKFSPAGGHIGIALYGGRREERCALDEGEQSVGGEKRKARGKGSAQGSSEAVVWISDEGCGMGSETKTHIFERFYQGDTSHASAGSGLGLALCRRIVELHGGTIDAQSAPGKGSVFEVRIPLPEAPYGRDSQRER